MVVMFLENPASQGPCSTDLVMIQYTILTPKHHIVEDILSI